MSIGLSAAAQHLFIHEIKELPLNGNVTSFHAQWWICSVTFLKDNLLSVKWGPELWAVQ